MRIGELLREWGWVEETSLDRAIAEQRHTGKRLCSMLVARGLLGADEAARALGAQLEVAAALQRHLENRDRKLARLIPPELGRSLCALPIGRGRSGELIVCVRDPRKENLTALAQATQLAIVFAVAPATQLERLVEQTYGPSPNEEFDVDLTTGPIDIPPDRAAELSAGYAAAVAREAAIDPLDMSAFTLVGLDDDRVSKDPTQSGQFVLPRATAPQVAFAEGTMIPAPAIKLPPAVAPVPRVATPTPAPAPVPPPAPVVEIAAPSLDDTLVQLQRATVRDTATDIAMAFAFGRWASALLLTIKEGVALGHRGHGPQLSEDTVVAVTVPLATTSIIRAAHDARKLVTEVPAKRGPIQDRLTRLLGQPVQQAAAPIVVGMRVACVLVVGDARDASHATTDMTLDLDDLAVALGSAYARIIHETKRT